MLTWSSPEHAHPSYLATGQVALLRAPYPGIEYAAKLSPAGWRIRRVRYGVVEGERQVARDDRPLAAQVEAAIEQWHAAFFGHLA